MPGSRSASSAKSTWVSARVSALRLSRDGAFGAVRAVTVTPPFTVLAVHGLAVQISGRWTCTGDGAGRAAGTGGGAGASKGVGTGKWSGKSGHSITINVHCAQAPITPCW
ncbi:tRNA pseudouridine synthase TruB [Streptomyces sp. NBRC 110611]|nr:tRNA pseudouridine synthase TruB [Streptomyces sp. NBRC 110611]